MCIDMHTLLAAPVGTHTFKARGSLACHGCVRQSWHAVAVVVLCRVCWVTGWSI